MRWRNGQEIIIRGGKKSHERLPIGFLRTPRSSINSAANTHDDGNASRTTTRNASDCDVVAGPSPRRPQHEQNAETIQSCTT
eukprot:6367782-Prymnesium_polylepis.1